MPVSRRRPEAGAVLLCGSRNDVHVKWVAAAIGVRGGKADVLDLFAGSPFNDHLQCGARKTTTLGTDLKDYRAVWNRLKIKLDPVFVQTDDRAVYFFEKEALHQYRGLFEICEEQGMLVANSGRSSYRAFHKPFQLRVAQDVGLGVPETLATNELHGAVEFAERLGGAAVKVYDSAFVAGSGDEPNRYVFTNHLAPEELHKIGSARFSRSINLLQQYIPKRCELRVVCSRRFCHIIEIDSQALDTTRTDWRRSEFLPIYRRGSLEPNIESCLKHYLQIMGLAYGVFDLIVDQAGKVWFLDCNPDGQWAVAQKATGVDIAGSFAETLLED